MNPGIKSNQQTPDICKPLLATFDTVPYQPLLEQNVYLHMVSAVENADSLTESDQGELAAYGFLELAEDADNSSQSHFFPLAPVPTEPGDTTRWHPVTIPIISYWNARVAEVAHPVLKARYLGVIWAFTEEVTCKKPAHTIAEQNIRQLIEIIQQKLFIAPTYARIKMERAITLAMKLNNTVLVDEVKACILQYEQAIPNTETHNFFGVAYDLLVIKKVKTVTEEETKEIIQALEARLTYLIEVDPWACEAVVNRLAPFYRKQGNPDEMKRVVLALGKAYENLIKRTSNTLSSGYIEHLHRIYTSYHLAHEAEQLLVPLRKTDKLSVDEFKSVGAETSYTREQIQEYVNEVLKGDTETMFIRIVLTGIPQKGIARQELTASSQSNHIRYLVSLTLVDKKGMTRASLKPLREDFESHLALHIADTIRIKGAFIHFIYQEAIKRGFFTVDGIMSFLNLSCLFDDCRKSLLQAALQYYFHNDHLVFMHLIIPQIEEAIRNLLEMNGGVVYVPKNGAFQLKTFDTLLREPIVADALGEDLANYFRILLTDPKGLNLRNDLCHGLLDAEAFNQQHSDSLLHALLCLGMIRSRDSKSD